MLTSQTAPLDLAKRVLTSTTLDAVRECQEIHLRGWKILDRWAFNSPAKLKDLEYSGEVVLLGRLLDQQNLEHRVLLELGTSTEGLSEHEILTMNEITTEL
jgi:hypothetical protein